MSGGTGQAPVSQEHKDADLVWRLHQQLVEGKANYDLVQLRARCQAKDKNKAGKLAKNDVSSKLPPYTPRIVGIIMTTAADRDIK